jgi:hypothetical protein
MQTRAKAYPTDLRRESWRGAGAHLRSCAVAFQAAHTCGVVYGGSSILCSVGHSCRDYPSPTLPCNLRLLQAVYTQDNTLAQEGEPWRTGACQAHRHQQALCSCCCPEWVALVPVHDIARFRVPTQHQQADALTKGLQLGWFAECPHGLLGDEDRGAYMLPT